MKRSLIFRLAFIVIAFVCFGPTTFGQTVSADGVWVPVDGERLLERGAERQGMPVSFGAFRLNGTSLRDVLSRAPREFSGEKGVVVILPMPDGSFQRFAVQRSPIAEPKLLAEYPELAETYNGQGIDDPTATVRFDNFSTGFHAIVLSAGDTVYVSPYETGNKTDHISFYHNKMPSERLSTECNTTGDDPNDLLSKLFSLKVNAPAVLSGSTLRTYRLAVAATAEYTQAFGGNTVAGALTSITTTINLMDAVYEREIAARLILVGNEASIIFTDPVTDGYTHDNANSMLNENQGRIDALIGTANYDVGHVFDGTILGGGFSFQGVAQIGGICGTGKARGVDIFRSVVPGDVIAYYSAAHEFGHQFGATHTMNGTGTGCAAARTASTAYEPASGSTIMGYRWNCGGQDLRSSDVYFHNASLEQIAVRQATAACGVETPTGNREPIVSAGGNYNIPANTPFALTAAATDPDGDPITYTWEEFDLGTLSPPDNDADGQARPIFRSMLATTSPTRTFPSLPYIQNFSNLPPTSVACPVGFGTCALGEALPTMTRTMNFRVTVRDNRSIAGINSAAMQVNVNGSAGPFTVTSPNSSVTYLGNSVQTVTWNVANTDVAPINAANVKISYSSDGGNTFPVVLADNTPNDGSQSVVIPIGNTTLGRIKVEAVGNIFFDISNVNFTVSGVSATTPTPTPSATPTPTPTPIQGGKKSLFDFDADGKADVAVYRPSDGNWYISRSRDGFYAQNFGNNTDKLAPADYDGDGKTDLAVYKPSTGVFFIYRSIDGGDGSAYWGLPEDIPCPADFDGDGKADVAIFRPSTGTFWIRRSASANSPLAMQYGTTGDQPVVGDYDGDGKADIAVYRPTTGIWYIHLSQTNTDTAVQFGIPSDKAVPGDFDGDGKTDVAVYRTQTGLWFIVNSTGGYTSYQFGYPTDTPAPADYDGDGKIDMSIFRPGENNFWINGTKAGVTVIGWGSGTDRPIANSYVR